MNLHLRVLLVAVLLLLAGSALADRTADEGALEAERLLRSAEESVAAGDRRKTDFYVARYVGKSLGEDRPMDTGRIKAVSDRLGLTPTSSLSPLFDESFVSWFVLATYHQWNVPDRGANEKDLTMVLAGETDGRYFAQIVGAPVLRSWAILRDQSTSILHLVDGSRKPYVVTGTMKDGRQDLFFESYAIDTGGSDIHSFQRPQFVDVDGDGTAEIVLRYTLTKGDGFSQVLELLHVVAERKVVPWKVFRSGPEGVARLEPNNDVVVAAAFASRPGLGHLSWDQTRIERYRFDKGAWHKIEERSQASILHSKEFEKYFFERTE